MPRKKLFAKLFFLAIIICSFAFVPQIKIAVSQTYFILNNADANFTQNYIIGFGDMAFIASMFVKVFQSIVFILPEKSTTIAIIGLFKPFIAFTILAIGNALACVICFMLSRFLLGDLVQFFKKKHNVWDKLKQFSGKYSGYICFSLALFAYVPSSIFALILGFSSISFKKFSLWFSMGLLPQILLYCLFENNYSGNLKSTAVAILAIISVAILLFKLKSFFIDSAQNKSI